MMPDVLDELREKYEDDDRIDSIHEEGLNGGRIPALQVNAAGSDMPYRLMYDLFHPDGEFIGQVVPHQFYAGILHDEAGDPVAVPVLYLVEASAEVHDEIAPE